MVCVYTVHWQPSVRPSGLCKKISPVCACSNPLHCYKTTTLCISNNSPTHDIHHITHLALTTSICVLKGNSPFVQPSTQCPRYKWSNTTTAFIRHTWHGYLPWCISHNHLLLYAYLRSILFKSTTYSFTKNIITHYVIFLVAFSYIAKYLPYSNVLQNLPVILVQCGEESWVSQIYIDNWLFSSV